MDDLIEEFSGNQNIFLTRYRSAKSRNGVIGSPILFRRRLKALITPLDAADMERLPDGMAGVNSAIKIISAEKIQTATPDKKTAADMVEVDGVKYQIDSVNPWVFDDLSHFEAIAFRVTT